MENIHAFTPDFPDDYYDLLDKESEISVRIRDLFDSRGRQPIPFNDPELEPILKEQYEVLQKMAVAMGRTLMQSDN